MTNRHSKAGHQPQRTCVVCRSQKDLKDLLAFFLLPEGLVFDPQRRVQRRRQYVCPDELCLRGLDKWRRSQMKRKFRLSSISAIFPRPEQT
ncbi:MAG: DUF448 domain-containing protein [Candidatus Cloacimonetes bacterium]|nr:DUF448 domain-containing protein [Candidatus Cloacimonadota bacterium]